MERGGQKHEAKLDQLLAEIAVRRGLLSPERVKEAQAEQAQGVARGRKRPRRLGAILAGRKALTDAQVFALLDEAEKQIAQEEIWKDHDTLLGRILVDAGLAGAEQVAECLLIQSDAMEGSAGPPPRLGELLVRKGYATEQDIGQALELQNGIVLACTACGNQCLFGSVDPRDPDHCPLCKGPMEALPDTSPSPAAPEAAPPKIRRRARPAPAPPRRAPPPASPGGKG